MQDSTQQNRIKELEALRDRLEEQNKQMTQELRAANELLRQETELRKKAESELRDSNERYRSIFDNSIDGIQLTGPDGSIYAVNQAACDMLGWTEQELCDGGRSLILDETDPKLAQVLTKRRHEGKFLGELNHKRKDGSVFPAEFSSALFRLSNGEIRTIIIIRDITERKQAEQKLQESEERFQLALQGADLGLWDWNIATGSLILNKRWTEMLGYALDEIIPHVSSWEKLVHPDDFPHVRNEIKAHLDGKKSFYETEHRLKSKSGAWVWVLDKGVVTHRDESGRPLRAVGTHLDITDRKLAEML
jgi:PAS domain S-box-containing protein